MTSMDINNKSLKNEYVHVTNNNILSFGGNQGWLPSKRLQGYACGAIAGTDLVLYLDGERSFPDVDSYNKRFHKDERLFPILPYFGISGIWLAPSIKLAFLKNRLHYKVRWGVFPKNLRKACEEMLENDIPVVFSVCQVFEFLWKPKGLQLYIKDASGNLIPRTRTTSHYMTLTALGGDVMTVSSWGCKYYAKWSEYEHLVRKRSFWLFSNICYVKKK